MADVILVDEQDNELGSMEKLAAHQQGKLHRAFSIFVYRNEQGLELLLQQRANTKYHAGGLWSNTCCSHPAPGEYICEAGERRLLEELGFSLPLKPVGSFIYQHHFDNGLIEYEYDHVLVAHAPASVSIIPNPEEVMNTRWVSLVALYQDLAEHPAQYTPWFARALAIATAS